MDLSDQRLAAFAAEVGADDPVTVVGGRTQWDVGGAVAPSVRQVRAPAGIVEYEPAEMTVRCGAGTTVADVDAALAEHGQLVALPDWPGATVGGRMAGTSRPCSSSRADAASAASSSPSTIGMIGDGWPGDSRST